MLGAFPDEVTFTSGTTEANNIAIFGYQASRAVASHLEHPCVIEPLKQLEADGVGRMASRRRSWRYRSGIRCLKTPSSV